LAQGIPGSIPTAFFSKMADDAARLLDEVWEVTGAEPERSLHRSRKVAVVLAVLGVVGCAAATWSAGSPLSPASVLDTIGLAKVDHPCTCYGPDGEYATTEQVMVGNITALPTDDPDQDCGGGKFCVLEGWGQCRFIGKKDSYLIHGLNKKGEDAAICLSECKANDGLITRDTMGSKHLDCGGAEIRSNTRKDDREGKKRSCEWYDKSEIPNRVNKIGSTAGLHRCWIMVGHPIGGKKGCKCSEKQQCQGYCWVGWGECNGDKKGPAVLAFTQNLCGECCRIDEGCDGYTFFQIRREDNCQKYALLPGGEDNNATATPIEKHPNYPIAECERKLTPDEVDTWESR